MLISFYKFFKLFLLILSVINTSPKLIEPEYNNGKVQDPNLDKSYTDISGQSLYYITREVIKLCII